MYIYKKSELLEHPMFQQAIMLSEMQTNAQWQSLYRDPTGELCIVFNGHLNKDQIKTVLMHFKDLIDGDTNTDNISVEEGIDFEHYYSNFVKDKFATRIYTPDGYDYSQF